MSITRTSCVAFIFHPFQLIAGRSRLPRHLGQPTIAGLDQRGCNTVCGVRSADPGGDTRSRRVGRAHPERKRDPCAPIALHGQIASHRALAASVFCFVFRRTSS